MEVGPPVHGPLVHGLLVGDDEGLGKAMEIDFDGDGTLDIGGESREVAKGIEAQAILHR